MEWGGNGADLLSAEYLFTCAIYRFRFAACTYGGGGSWVCACLPRSLRVAAPLREVPEVRPGASCVPGIWFHGRIIYGRVPCWFCRVGIVS